MSITTINNIVSSGLLADRPTSPSLVAPSTGSKPSVFYLATDVPAAYAWDFTNAVWILIGSKKVPLLSNFTIGNQPAGSTFSDTSTGIVMQGPSQSLVLQALEYNTALTSTSFTIIAHVLPAFGTGNSGAGIFVRDASGKVVQWGTSPPAASGQLENLNYWNTYTSFNSNPVNFTGAAQYWIKMTSDGTTFSFYNGTDMNAMALRTTASATAFIGTPTKVGIYQYLYTEGLTTAFPYFSLA
jgi:hypothetical protein